MRNHYFISLVACNLLHEMGNRWCEESRLELHWVNPRTAGYSINLWATWCAVGNSSCIKMHATMSHYIQPPKSAVDFNNVLNVRKIHRTLFYLPRSVQLVARNEESLMWRMAFGVTLGQSTNSRVFDKSVDDIVCGVESIVHQDARYHVLLY